MENPYWHDQYKPHQTDRIDIRLLCFEINCVVSTSIGQQGSGMAPDEDDPREITILDELCFKMAESELSKRLLKLALLVRTFDETMTRSEKVESYLAHRNRIELQHEVFGQVFKGAENSTKTLRECSNKIIHAEDVRPVYDTDDSRNAPYAMWGMTGTLELEGRRGEAEWSVSIYLKTYLEGILELIQFDES